MDFLCLQINLEVILVRLARLFNLNISKEIVLKQQLLNAEAIFWFLLQTLINKVLECGAPALRNPRHWLIHNAI